MKPQLVLLQMTPRACVLLIYDGKDKLWSFFAAHEIHMAHLHLRAQVNVWIQLNRADELVQDVITSWQLIIGKGEVDHSLYI